MKIKVKLLLKLIIIMLIFQIMLMAIKQFLFLFYERTNYIDRICSMIAMTILSAILIIICIRFKQKLSIFPQKFNIFYIFASIFAFVFFVTTPFITNNIKIASWLLLIYSAIITPIFEETLFRGYIWNQLESVIDKPWKVYIIDTVLFAVWHLGYIESIAFRAPENLTTIMLWKVLIGMLFGIVLGAVRLKTKNCYSTMILHGVLNILAG